MSLVYFICYLSKNLNKDMKNFCNFLCKSKNKFYFCIVKNKYWAMV